MSKVLIVDDEKSMRITLSKLLSNEFYEVDTAESAVIACQMIKQNNYDVILTDIVMPQMSGIEFLTYIRKQSGTIQIIVMTGEPTVETAVKAVQLGANDYITKPISKEALLKTINNATHLKLLYDQKAELEEQNEIYQKKS